MKEIILYTYGYLVFFYSMALMFSYVMLVALSFRETRRSRHSLSDIYVKKIFDNSPYTPRCVYRGSRLQRGEHHRGQREVAALARLAQV